MFIEQHWIRKRLCGEPPAEPALHALYFPELSPKGTRGLRLPRKQTLLQWAETRQREHLALLVDPPAAALAHPLWHDDYLLLLLLQHHAQHVETMRMALAQRNAQAAASANGSRIEPRHAAPDCVRLPAGEYRLGCGDSRAYDNEQPPRTVRLPEWRLMRRPVRNDEYLAFIADGGYRSRRWWSEAGWHWREAQGVEHPEHWRQDGTGGWLQITPAGSEPLDPIATLLGISYYEAEAYAHWLGGCLPHEYHWEAAAAAGVLEGIGGAWEWCGNRFHPYPGFRAFPYDGYSLPWFDGRHGVLRGASPYTLPWVRRPSFRNFYEFGKRHVFAGCRVAWAVTG